MLSPGREPAPMARWYRSTSLDSQLKVLVPTWAPTAARGSMGMVVSRLLWRCAVDGDRTSRDVLSGQVAEGQGGPDGGARPGVRVPHHRRRHVAGGVEALDDRPVGPQDPGPLVGDQTALGAQVAR